MKTSEPTENHSILNIHGQIPSYFIPNVGQLEEESIHYSTKCRGYNAYFTSEGVTFIFLKYIQNNKLDKIREKIDQSEGENFRLDFLFLHSNQNVKPIGKTSLPGKIHYFKGNDPAKWHTNIPVFKEIVYPDLWPGIDLVFTGEEDTIKYEFVVHPGANLEDIRLTYRGSDRISIDEDGSLSISTPFGQIKDKRPISYQYIGEEQFFFETAFRLSPDGVETIIDFEMEKDYDPRYSLIIDPSLVYSSYLGGSQIEQGVSIAVDSSGNAYVTGTTLSPTGTFPTLNAFQPTHGLSGDAFVTKISPTGDLIYSSYLGGDGYEEALGIVVDSSGNAYVTGYTNSYTNTFPTVNAFQPSYGGGQSDIFVTKVGPTGNLIYSSYLGGNQEEYSYSIAVDNSGNAYLTGITISFIRENNFPTVNAFQPEYGGGEADAFVTKIGPTGNLVYSSYLGGSGVLEGTGAEEGLGIAADDSGNAYVTGRTNSSTETFPTVNAFQPAYGGGDFDAFVTKVGPTGNLVYSSFLGGTQDDRGYHIAVDDSGNAYVTGGTTSPTGTFPTVNAFQPAYGGSGDAFVTKVGPTGNLVYSSYLGGTGIEANKALAVDDSGNAYVTGYTNSPTGTFPTTVNAFQPSYGGGDSDAFVTKVGPTGDLIYSSYLGGTGLDESYSIAADAFGNAYVTGRTTSPTGTFPTVNAFQSAYGGGNSDAFVAQVGPTGDLVYSSYLGGTDTDEGKSIAADNFGNAYVTGFTRSPTGTFPIVHAFQPAYGGQGDAFVTKIGPAGPPPAMPIANVSPTSINFGDQPVNTSSYPQTVTVTNTGTADLIINNAMIAGTNPTDFQVVSNMCTTVTPGNSCTIQLTFHPTAAGPRSATLDIFDNASGSPHQVLLNGNGLSTMPIANVNPTSINFGNQPVSTSSSPQTVTVTNTGTADLIINNVMIAGANPTDFQVVSNMCTTVTPGNSCTIQVRFNPTTTGSRSATLDIFNNASDSPQQVLLNGNGLPSADLMITKNASVVPTGLNTRQITYTITVMNLGPNTANNVVVTDPLQSNTKFVSATTSQGTFTAPRRGRSGTVTFTLGNISAGSSATMRIVVTAGATPVTNTATVTSSTFDPGPHPNSVSVIV